MKKLILLLVQLPIVTIMMAQTTKGNFVLGLHNYSPGPIGQLSIPLNPFPQTNGFGLSFGSVKEKYDGQPDEGSENSTVIGFSFNSLYFAADQFAVGLTGNFSSGRTVYKEDGEEDDEASGTILLLGPEVRYYFNAGEKAKVWLKGGAGFGSISSKYNGEGSDPINLSQFGGGVGISLFPVSTISVDFGLGYNVLTSTDNSDFGDYQYINSLLTFDLGFGIYF